MPKKPPAKRPLRKTFLFNLIVIVLICATLYWVFVSSLGWYTHHGESIATPNLIGMTLPEAQSAIKPYQFKLQVDSTYSPKKKSLTILSQQPDPGFGIKTGHTLIVTVNKAVAPTIPMPSLIHLSFRSAQMLLETNKLILEDTIMEPDIAKGAVLKQLLNGQPVESGTTIPQGSKITLVVGSGFAQTKLNVPNIIGMSFPEATAFLSGSNLNYHVTFVGTISDTTTAVVIDQLPRASDSLNATPNTIEEGMAINFVVAQNPTPTTP